MLVIDAIAPKKEVRVKQRTGPWMTGEILENINQRDRFFNKFKCSKDNADHNKFLYYRNQVKYQKEKAKSEYYVNAVNDNRNQPQKLWQILKSLGSSSKCKTKSRSLGLKIEDNLNFDHVTVAEHFNDFFTTIAAKLVEKLPIASGRFGLDYIKSYYNRLNVSENSFLLKSVSHELIVRILSSMSPCKATGLDNIPARFVKDGAEIIAQPVRHIINLSLSVGKVPEDFKLARVVPLHKKNSKTEVGNYRPVSVLNIMSKVVERVVFDQLYGYLSENKLLYELQSGFRSSYSTDTCLMYLTDYIRQECDKGRYTGMVMLDLQKAFDTVNHAILLQKLSALGMRDESVDWFRSYLSGRSQVVDVNGTFSSEHCITCGVPQGSILGPLLFLIYVNDMSAAVKCQLLLYADDSALMVSGKDVAEIEAALSGELEEIQDWLVNNKLSLHLGKTESILFG